MYDERKRNLEWEAAAGDRRGLGSWENIAMKRNEFKFSVDLGALAIAVFFITLIVLAVCGCNDGPLPRTTNRERTEFSKGYDHGYVRCSLDTERRMQSGAVKYGGAHSEGDNDQWFVWSQLNQRFTRVKD